MNHLAFKASRPTPGKKALITWQWQPPTMSIKVNVDAVLELVWAVGVTGAVVTGTSGFVATVQSALVMEAMAMRGVCLLAGKLRRFLAFLES